MKRLNFPSWISNKNCKPFPSRMWRQDKNGKCAVLCNPCSNAVYMLFLLTFSGKNFSSFTKHPILCFEQYNIIMAWLAWKILQWKQKRKFMMFYRCLIGIGTSCILGYFVTVSCFMQIAKKSVVSLYNFEEDWMLMAKFLLPKCQDPAPQFRCLFYSHAFSFSWCC